MLAELGAAEVLIITLAALAVWIWTFVVAARRGRWGWCALIFLFQALAIIVFWLVNPQPIDRGPRPA